ncbi:MAG: efflux RND transporter permease subunit [Bacteriovoracaceae bacterium]|nr:efflux RND transporter permease subunit [Bacteriovoracaceae bacterium]
MKITQYFVERQKLTHLLLIFVLLSGLFSVISLPRQDTPNVDFYILTIQTFYPGASPEDVEVNVTDLLEDELEQVDGLEEMSSFSIEGMSAIFITLDPDTEDVDQIKDNVRSALDRVSNFPSEVENRPTITEMKSTDFPILEVAVYGHDDERLLRKIAKDLESEIRTIDKVGKIEKIGYRAPEISIDLDQSKLSKYHISFYEVITAIKARNIKVSGGTLESFVDEKKIVTFSEFQDPLDVKDVIIRSNFSGKGLKVKDVAKVSNSFQRRKTITKTNGINSINLIVKRRGTTDVINLSKKINSVVDKYQKTYKDRGIQIVKVVDFTHYTKSLLNIVANNALIGFILVIISLFIFLNFRSAFWVAVGIPLSILAAYIFFPMFGVTTNQITLITVIMVLGMLVDDAIVIAENINRHIENGLSPKEAALHGTKEVFYPVLATIATTILCFVPIYFMKGIMGRFVMAIPTVVILTLLMSLLESTTLLPAHLSAKKGDTKLKKQTWFESIRQIYSKALHFFLKYKKTTLIFFMFFFLASVGIFSKFSRFDLFPTEDFDLFYIVMETPSGSSLQQTAKQVLQVEKIVSEIPKNLMVGYKTMVGDHRTDEAASSPALHENWALITVYLYPASQRDTKSERIIEKLQQAAKDITGFTKLDIRELQDGPPVGSPITVRFVSDNFSDCKQYAKQLVSYLSTIKGTKDIESSNRPGKKEIRLKLDYELLARLDISAVSIADTIRSAYDGKIATTIRRDGEEIDFRVQLMKSQRGNLDVLSELQVPNKLGKLIKLSKVVTFEEGLTDETIAHFDGKRAITVTGNVDSKIITPAKVNALIKKEFEDKIRNTPGLSIYFGGHEKETMKSMDNFIFAFIVAILAIYFVLVLLLNSFFQPFLIMIAVPFGFVGVFYAFLLHGYPMSFIGVIGTLGMIGVVVNDSLVMVTHLNTIRLDRQNFNLEDLITGAKTRLRPVLLTTITTVLGLLPTVYGWGGYEPFLVPMVLSMSWGLMFATVVTLLLIPALYSIFYIRKAAI